MKQTPRNPVKKHNVFLSHSGANQDWVVELGAELRIQGLRPFLNKWSRRPQDLWRKLSESAFRDEGYSCLVVAGQDGFGPWATDTLPAAVTQDPDFAVILIFPPGVESPPLPPILGNAEQIRFQSDDDPEALRCLLSALRGDAPTTREATTTLEMGGPKQPPEAADRGSMASPQVFISYSHDSPEHKKQVLALANRLRRDGVETVLDQFLQSPNQGWYRWMIDEVEKAQAVLIIATKIYYDRFRLKAPVGEGRGVKDEGGLILTGLSEGDGLNPKFIPVLFSGQDATWIPEPLRQVSHYVLKGEEDYQHLLRRLLDQPAVTPEPLGNPPELQQAARPLWSAPTAPSYDPRTADLVQRQTALRQRLKKETAAEQDTTSTRAEMLDLRRQIREGPLPTPGDVLADRYELLEIVGQGGFAQVWKAWDEEKSRLVAVKILHGQFMNDETRKQRFFRGARHMADLRHPRIVSVLDQKCQDGAFHFFVMEYLAGGDLRSAVRAAKIGGVAGLDIIRQIGDALHHAHQQGVIHRDVKPANVLLDDNGAPKLTDFDLVRAADTTGGTRTGALGTFVYAAPEALHQAQDADVRTDLYGLGMTAAFVLRGEELPVDSFRDAPTFVRSLQAPEGFREVLAKAVAWEPDDRYPSVATFLEALDTAMQEPEPAPDPKPPTPQEGTSKRNRPDDPLDPLREILRENHAGGEDLREVDNLPKLLEKGLPTVPEDRRPQCALEITRAWPKTTDLTELGILAWTLDYFAIRDPDSAQEATLLKDELFATLRAQHSPPSKTKMAESGDWKPIPAGEFLMGSPPAEQGHSDERPQHPVVITRAFHLLDHQVTNQEYRVLVPEKSGGDHLPVVGVSWYQVYAYAAWLGGRLPTEAEWEYACRAGETTRYSSGETEADLKRVGWYEGNADGKLQPVKKKDPNAWGLYDMHGNVWEWAADWKGSYSSDKRQDPLGPTSGVLRVVRGGGYWNSAVRARSSCRDWDLPGDRWQFRGFRVVVPVAPEP
jgi:eukaryotic-like serine/threonine-protein kinase